MSRMYVCYQEKDEDGCCISAKSPERAAEKYAKGQHKHPANREFIVLVNDAPYVVEYGRGAAAKIYTCMIGSKRRTVYASSAAAAAAFMAKIQDKRPNKVLVSSTGKEFIAYKIRTETMFIAVKEEPFLSPYKPLPEKPYERSIKEPA